MFLSSSFPLGEKSGVNLRGNFNTSKVTLFESQIDEKVEATPKEEVEGVTEPQAGASDVKTEELKMDVDTKQGESPSFFYVILVTDYRLHDQSMTSTPCSGRFSASSRIPRLFSKLPPQSTLSPIFERGYRAPLTRSPSLPNGRRSYSALAKKEESVRRERGRQRRMTTRRK